MTDEEVIKDYWKWEKEMKSKITQAHTDGYNRGLAKAEEKIADLKANFDYVLEGKDLEIKTLGERCNQLLKDKGDLTDELAEWKDEWQEQVQKATDEGWERTKLTGRVRELEQQIEKMKCCSNCKHSRTEYEHCRTDKHEKWEIKEK